MKSTTDLHKLWYVLQKEKNALFGDKKVFKFGNLETKELDERLRKVKLSMRRILGVVNQRIQIQKLYKTKLEDEYIERKR